jgi:hypothetical protein
MNPDFEKIKKQISNPATFGPGIWYVIHLNAKKANNEASKKQFKEFMEHTIQNLPCSTCQQHATSYYQSNPLKDYWNVKENGEDIGLFKWTWNFHNTVNNKLKKPYVTWENAKMLFDSNSGVCTSDCGGDHEHEKKEKEERERQQTVRNYQENISIAQNDALQKFIPKSVIRPNNSEKNKSNRFRNV